MTFLNRMIQAAKSENPPPELTIRPNQVNALVDHMQACQFGYTRSDASQLRQKVLDGKVKMINTPIRVLGQSSEAR